MACATTGRGRSCCFYILPEDLDFPRLPRGAIFHVATAKGPRFGLTEPVMLTQHELAIALDPVVPANSWRCWQVHCSVKPNAMRNTFALEGVFDDAEDLGVCCDDDAGAADEVDGEDMSIAEAMQADVDAVSEGISGSASGLRSVALIHCDELLSQ